MNTWKCAAVLMAFLAAATVSRDVRAQATAPVDPDVAANVRALTRGPIHEAFAGAVTYGPGPAFIVRREPPAPVREVAPPPPPEGRGMLWIPGYWAWDDERNGFIWVSGIWRHPPPGRRWVPGVWEAADGAARWAPGFWQDATIVATVYLPAPPPSREIRPARPSPDERAVWVPGFWVRDAGRYVWRAGYWMAPVAGAVWIPSHYSWTPRGYVFVSGYWDHELAERGVLYAPATFLEPVYLRADFVLTPRVRIELADLPGRLFVRPAYGHYYYGDYFDARYETAGIFPWFAERTREREYYDPLFNHYSRTLARSQPDWPERVRARYAAMRARPADTRFGPQPVAGRGYGTIVRPTRERVRFVPEPDAARAVERIRIEPPRRVRSDGERARDWERSASEALLDYAAQADDVMRARQQVRSEYVRERGRRTNEAALERHAQERARRTTNLLRGLSTPAPGSPRVEVIGPERSTVRSRAIGADRGMSKPLVRAWDMEWIERGTRGGTEGFETWPGGVGIRSDTRPAETGVEAAEPSRWHGLTVPTPAGETIGPDAGIESLDRGRRPASVTPVREGISRGENTPSGFKVNVPDTPPYRGDRGREVRPTRQYEGARD